MGRVRPRTPCVPPPRGARHSNYNFALAVLGAPVDIGTKIREYQHVVKVGVNYRFGAY
jgi:hypothetical protein